MQPMTALYIARGIAFLILLCGAIVVIKKGTPAIIGFMSGFAASLVVEYILFPIALRYTTVALDTVSFLTQSGMMPFAEVLVAALMEILPYLVFGLCFSKTANYSMAGGFGFGWWATSCVYTLLNFLTDIFNSASFVFTGKALETFLSVITLPMAFPISFTVAVLVTACFVLREAGSGFKAFLYLLCYRLLLAVPSVFSVSESVIVGFACIYLFCVFSAAVKKGKRISLYRSIEKRVMQRNSANKDKKNLPIIKEAPSDKEKAEGEPEVCSDEESESSISIESNIFVNDEEPVEESDEEPAVEEPAPTPSKELYENENIEETFGDCDARRPIETGVFPDDGNAIGCTDEELSSEDELPGVPCNTADQHDDSPVSNPESAGTAEIETKDEEAALRQQKTELFETENEQHVRRNLFVHTQRIDKRKQDALALFDDDEEDDDEDCDELPEIILFEKKSRSGKKQR